MVCRIQHKGHVFVHPVISTISTISTARHNAAVMYTIATQRNTLPGESNRCACGLLLLEIRTPTHRKQIARIMTASPPVLSPSSILPQPSSHCPFNVSVKNSARFKNVIISFINLLTTSLSLKLRNFETAYFAECTYI